MRNSQRFATASTAIIKDSVTWPAFNLICCNLRSLILHLEMASFELLGLVQVNIFVAGDYNSIGRYLGFLQLDFQEGADLF